MFSQHCFSGAIAIAVIVSSPLAAQPAKVLKVGVAGSAPFVIPAEPFPSGISVEIWRELAQRENLSYQIIPQKGVKSGIDALARGKLDILVGPVSITAERLKQVAFSQPYYQADIGLLTLGRPPTLWSRVKPLFQIAIITSVGGLVFALFLVGNLIWLAEHRRNEQQFPKAYVRGVGSGMWFALVTLTTVGYGDKTPITKTGKIITGFWMLVTMVAASSLTAGLATAMTLILSEQAENSFAHLDDIRSKRVAVVSGTTGENWARFYQARVMPSANLAQAIQRLISRQVEGVVFDVPALQYYLNQHPELPLKLADISFATEDYGFAFSPKSQLVQPLNVALFELKESGRLAEIINRELQGDLPNIDENETQP